MFIFLSQISILSWDHTPNNNAYAMLKINSNVEVVKETNYLNIFFLLNGVCLYVNRCAHARIDMYGTA